MRITSPSRFPGLDVSRHQASRSHVLFSPTIFETVVLSWLRRQIRHLHEIFLFSFDLRSGNMSSSSRPPDSATGAPVPIPRPQANTLLTSFTAFLTITIHTILYYRRLYPQQTFLMTKAHNLPVPQSRHPALCEWINSALAAIQDQLALGVVTKVCIVTHAPDSMAVVERWVFDVTNFPVWATGKGKEKLGAGQRFQRREEEDDDGSVNWVDVNEAYRGALRRISYAGEMKGPLPEGCTFTLAVELRDEAPAPIGVCCKLSTFGKPGS